MQVVLKKGLCYKEKTHALVSCMSRHTNHLRAEKEKEFWFAAYDIEQKLLSNSSIEGYDFVLFYTWLANRKVFP